MSTIIRFGIDLAKDSFAICGIDERGAVALRKTLGRHNSTKKRKTRRPSRPINTSLDRAQSELPYGVPPESHTSSPVKALVAPACSKPSVCVEPTGAGETK